MNETNTGIATDKFVNAPPLKLKVFKKNYELRMQDTQLVNKIS